VPSDQPRPSVESRAKATLPLAKAGEVAAAPLSAEPGSHRYTVRSGVPDYSAAVQPRGLLSCVLCGLREPGSSPLSRGEHCGGSRKPPRLSPALALNPHVSSSKRSFSRGELARGVEGPPVRDCHPAPPPPPSGNQNAEGTSRASPEQPSDDGAMRQGRSACGRARMRCA
jgi:hypothetical protein